mmetsp:Transcript_97684/g.252792  ORF Transcript_97684/g.252792 Transcript_97684/m.252792 type:complete len:296 (-) Transcript_97684:48-935(-)
MAGAGAAVLECPEGSRLLVPGGAQNVLRAWFGDAAQPWQEGEGCGRFCTDTVVQRLAESGGAIVASCPCLGDDPAHGTFKHLLVEVRDEELKGEARVEDAGGPRLFDAPDEVLSAPRWIAFVRHAQAGHNVDEALVGTPDNPLTPAGEAQARAAAEGPAGAAVRGAELVITSPLMRAMQTTALLLGDGAPEDTRVLIDTAGTERWSAPCDEGTLKSELREQVPKAFLDWEGWDTLPERWWPERGEDSWARAQEFVEMIRRRPEERIVCVGHGAFWQTVLGRYLKNCEVVFCDRFL